MSIDLNIKLQDEEANANKCDHDMENDETSKSTTDDYQDMHANKCDHDMENDETSKSTTDDYQDMPELFTPRTPLYTSPSLSNTNLTLSKQGVYYGCHFVPVHDTVWGSRHQRNDNSCTCFSIATDL